MQGSTTYAYVSVSLSALLLLRLAWCGDRASPDLGAQTQLDQTHASPFGQVKRPVFNELLARAGETLAPGYQTGSYVEPRMISEG